MVVMLSLLMWMPVVGPFPSSTWIAGRRLVGEQQRRLVHQRPRQRHALLLPAGEASGVTPHEILETEITKQGKALRRASREESPAASAGSATLSSTGAPASSLAS